jgi:hypothetical protein
VKALNRGGKMRRVSLILVLNFFGLSVFGAWETDKRITDYPAHSDYGSNNNAWTIAVQDTFVHIVWEHQSGGIGELNYVQSTDDGNTFGPHKQLTIQDSHHPSICVFDSFVHIAWMDFRDGNYEIYYNRSTDFGLTWDIESRITTDAADSWGPSICCSDSFVHIVWDDFRDNNFEIYYNRSADFGSTWDIDNFRLDTDVDDSWSPSICCSDSFVHVTWLDWRDGNEEVYYDRSSDYGTGWDVESRITTDAASSGFPSICCIDSFVHIVWQDGMDGNNEIYYNRSRDFGLAWDIDNFRLTNDADTSGHPSICCIDTSVHVVWQDDRDGNKEIYYNQSTDHGANWAIDERLTVDAGNSALASIACTRCPGYDVHVAWTDERDGNKEIYYKRNPCPITGVSEDKELRVKSLELRVRAVSRGTDKMPVLLLFAPNAMEVDIRVYDVCGKLKQVVYEGVLSKGEHTFASDFDGTGVYFAVLRAQKSKKSLKMIRL